MIRELWRRFERLWQRAQFERELEEEMRHHLALKAEETGSITVANRSFGNVTLWKEDSRAMWTWRFAEEFLQDVRYAWRMMAANRVFSAMAVLSLALGIGANTAIYSFMEAILLRTLPVGQPQELVLVNWASRNRPAVIHSQRGTRHRDDRRGVTSPNYPFAAYQALRNNQDLFSSLFAYSFTGSLNVVARQQAESLDGLSVSGDFFPGLGLPPAAGRAIEDADDHSGAPLVTVIAYDYWKRRFSLDPAAIGQPILLNHVPFTIVGVAPPAFTGLDPQWQADLFVPLHALPALSPNPAEEEQKRFFDNNSYWVEMMARLRPGVTIDRAQAALAAQFHRFAESTATTAAEKTGLPELWLESGSSGIDSLRRQYSRPVLVLMIMVALILTIACANIANLLLARAAARQREMAVRLSLGAGRARIMRQLLTESVILSLTGGVVGLLVAVWGIRSITWLLSNGHERFPLHPGLNLPVLAFTLLLALVTGIVFGLAPAIQATRLDLTPSLKEVRGSERRAGRRRVPVGLGQCLVVAQIAISLLLVIGATLFVRTLANLNAVELGFNRENVLLFNVNARQAGHQDAAIAALYAGLLDRLRTLPGVRNAGFSDYPLLAGRWSSTNLFIPGLPNPSGKTLETCVLKVDASFLPTMQIPVLWGRGLEERDLHSPRVAVVTEKFATQFFGKENPLGRKIGLNNAKSPVDIEIVGVARTTHYNAIDEDPPAVAYIPYTQNPAALRGVTFEIRAVGDPLVLTNAVRQIVRDADPNLPVTDVTTQSRQIDEGISQQRTFANLCTCFALLALLIAGVGLYGTMAYAVVRRTAEIGIRMALGAGRHTIVWMVMREVFLLASVGLAIGLAAAWETTHLVAAFLFGTRPHDASTLALSIAILAAAALAAGYAPARRASRTEPMAALRHQ